VSLVNPCEAMEFVWLEIALTIEAFVWLWKLRWPRVQHEKSTCPSLILKLSLVLFVHKRIKERTFGFCIQLWKPKSGDHTSSNLQQNLEKTLEILKLTHTTMFHSSWRATDQQQVYACFAQPDITTKLRFDDQNLTFQASVYATLLVSNVRWPC
jgi:hypothetical protein